QPAWSPSGARIAFWGMRGSQRDVFTIAADGGDPVAVTNDEPTDWAPAWSPDGGSLFFSSDRGGPMELWRIAIDERTGRTAGHPELVLGGVAASAVFASLSTDGSRLAFESLITSANPVALAFDPITGRPGAITVIETHNRQLKPTDVSPDGKH